MPEKNGKRPLDPYKLVRSCLGVYMVARICGRGNLTLNPAVKQRMRLEMLLEVLIRLYRRWCQYISDPEVQLPADLTGLQDCLATLIHEKQSTFWHRWTVVHPPRMISDDSLVTASVDISYWKTSQYARRRRLRLLIEQTSSTTCCCCRSYMSCCETSMSVCTLWQHG